MARDDPQMKLRMPEDLRDRIASAARSNSRSMNAEILIRLEASFNASSEHIGRDGDLKSSLQKSIAILSVLEKNISDTKSHQDDNLEGAIMKLIASRK